MNPTAWAVLAACMLAGRAAAAVPLVDSDLLRQATVRGASSSSKITCDQDAPGGCDGAKTGKWGFHTENEPDPWWQVDLGQASPIARVVVWNRCDSEAMAARNARLKVLVSHDGRTFRQVYQHDGKVFWGQKGGPPLAVDLKEAGGRYLRIQLPGRTYFCLDEIEVLSPDGANLALNRPASQSSTSQWSVNHLASTGQITHAATTAAIDRGLKLAAHLSSAGIDTRNASAALEALRPKAAAGDSAAKDAYLQAGRIVRTLALRNPLLDFDAILFTKAAPGRFPHMSDQFYGWWSRPGGGVYLLENFKSDSPRLRCLTQDMPEGSFLRPELSFDGKKVLFAYCRYYPHVADLRDKATKSNLPEDAFYHLYEMSLDGTNRRQLTRGRYDDFDARYLPGGGIVFLSTRKGQFLQCTAANSASTAAKDLEDSYVRCGGDNYRPVPVFTLHAIDEDGTRLRPLSAFENFEWTPALAHDGRILYTRWDYIDRFNGHFFSLWSTNPDGTNAQLVYGNYTVRPQVVCEAMPIPGSNKLMFTASAHHSILGGSLVLLDPAKGNEGEAPLTRLTPDVPFPETEANVDCYYVNPYPLSEEHCLVAWSDRKLPPHCRVDDTEQNPVNATGLYLYDAFGNLTLLYRDPALACWSPIPVRPRPRPTALPETVAWDGAQEGRFVIQDIYQGLPEVKRGTIKAIRVIGTPPKVQPHMNNPVLGVSAEDPGKFLIGLAPVEPDGSAHFRVPSGVSVLFQAVDEQGYAIQTMRSLTYVGPQQTLSCIGCHEPRESAPRPAAVPLATRREPSHLAPGPEGSWPLRYDRLVQPVLDAHCTTCHSPTAADPKGRQLDLTPQKSYASLITFADKDLHKLAFERDRSIAGEVSARRTRLMQTLSAGHYDAKLSPSDFDRLVTWIDLYAMRQGHFSDHQERALTTLREQWQRRERAGSAEPPPATPPAP